MQSSNHLPTNPTIVNMPYSRFIEKGWGSFNEQGETILNKHMVEHFNILPIVYPDAYYPELNNIKRYQNWLGGNGSAKSFSKAKQLLVKACNPNSYFRLLYVRKQATSIRKSQYQLFEDTIKSNNLSPYFRCYSGSMDIVCLTTDHLLYSAGLDDVNKLTSITEITDIWIEEPIVYKGSVQTLVTEQDFEELNIRLRTQKATNQMHMTFNPISKSFWIYKQFYSDKPKERKFNESQTNTLITTYLDNPFLTKDYIQLVESFEGDRATFGKEGKWSEAKTGNEWLSKFERSKHVKKVGYLKDAEVNLTFDFNLLPYQTCLCIQLLRKDNGMLQVRVFKEYCLEPPLNTPEYACEFFIQDFPTARNQFVPVSVYGDASGRFGYDAYRGIFSALAHYTHQNSDQVIRKNPIIRTARDLINEILEGKFEGIEIVIDESCEHLIEDLETLQTAPEGFNNEKKDGIEKKGHCYSAFVYYICKVFDYLLKENQRT